MEKINYILKHVEFETDVSHTSWKQNHVVRDRLVNTPYIPTATGHIQRRKRNANQMANTQILSTALKNYMYKLEKSY